MKVVTLVALVEIMFSDITLCHGYMTSYFMYFFPVHLDEARSPGRRNLTKFLLAFTDSENNLAVLGTEGIK